MTIATNCKRIFDEDFNVLMWDDESIAFVKLCVKGGKESWNIYSADGTKIAEASSREYAFIIAKQNDYLPCSVH